MHAAFADTHVASTGHNNALPAMPCLQSSQSISRHDMTEFGYVGILIPVLLSSFSTLRFRCIDELSSVE